MKQIKNSIAIKKNLKEFKPAIIFITRFLILYFVLNLIYGFYIESFDQADSITYWVTNQSAQVIGWFYSGIYVTPDAVKSTVHIGNQVSDILSVYEGCNGVNVVIVFLSFLIAFPGRMIKLWWYAPMGIIIIHIFNISRIVFLYWVATSLPNLYYFTHKYLFTGIIYLAVFILWYIWVVKFQSKSD